MNKLFTYGTLQNKHVQMELLGRELSGERVEMTGYILGQLYADDGWYPCIYAYTPDAVVHGTMYQVSNDELWEIDKYEGENYKRILIDDYYVYVKA